MGSIVSSGRRNSDGIVEIFWETLTVRYLDIYCCSTLQLDLGLATSSLNWLCRILSCVLCM
jgi:hypothetical protein